jgi:hypothetical protein
MQKLSQKDIKTLKMGVLGVGLILVLFGAMKWMEHWKQVRVEIADIKEKLNTIDVEKSKQAGVMSIVPVFEMPQAEEQQTFAFRNKLRDQFKQAGINNKPLRVLTTGKTRLGGFKLVRVDCSAKCRFTQLMDFLARLNENPYLVGVEEMRIRCDKKSPQDVDVDITFSTLSK